MERGGVSNLHLSHPCEIEALMGVARCKWRLTARASARQVGRKGISIERTFQAVSDRAELETKVWHTEGLLSQRAWHMLWPKLCAFWGAFVGLW